MINGAVFCCFEGCFQNLSILIHYIEPVQKYKVLK